MPRDRSCAPSSKDITEAMDRASARLTELYPGDQIVAAPRRWGELTSFHGRQLPIFLVGSIVVTKADGHELTYLVRWDVRYRTGRAQLQATHPVLVSEATANCEA